MKSWNRQGGMRKIPWLTQSRAVLSGKEAEQAWLCGMRRRSSG